MKATPLEDNKECKYCYGTGENPRNMGDVCGYCYGTGLQSETCNGCQGDGLTKDEMKLCVKIPKSIENGMLLRVRDKGHQALNGNCGDLILTVCVNEDPNYQREGYDILST